MPIFKTTANLHITFNRQKQLIVRILLQILLYLVLVKRYTVFIYIIYHGIINICGHQFLVD